MAEHFLALTPDRVLSAVEALGLRPSGHVMALTCLENRVHDVRLEDGRHVVVKFYRPGRWSREALREEHAFLAELHAHEIPVCAPLVLRGSSLHQVHGIHYAVWPRAGGRSPSELADPEVEQLGRLLGRIHAVGASRAAPARPRLTGARYVAEPLELLDGRGLLPAACRARYRGAATALAKLYDERSRGVPCHRIHGDCHLGNLLRGPAGGSEGDAWFFLDFDDMLTGPAVQDVWMLLPGRDPEAERQRRLLLEGYRQFFDFDERWLGLVEPLRGLRFVRYAAWIGRRWQDPAFPAAFPHFGSGDYWERETQDLEALLGGLQEATAGGGASPAAATPELTNADFFWDL